MAIRQVFFLSAMLCAAVLTEACSTVHESYCRNPVLSKDASYSSRYDTLVKESVRKGKVRYRIYSLNGKRLFIEDFNYFKDGRYAVSHKAGFFKKPQGPGYGYYPDGKLWFKTFFVNGKSSGDCTYYYPNGQIESQGRCTPNGPNGTWRMFWDNGRPYATLHYENNRLKSVDGYFDKTGQPLPKGSFDNGNGELLIYSEEDLSLEEIEIYQDGKKVKSRKPTGKQ